MYSRVYRKEDGVENEIKKIVYVLESFRASRKIPGLVRVTEDGKKKKKNWG